MVDLSPFIIAKSDQLNADDLKDTGRLGGPITVKITRVTGTGDKEQPISISFQNDDGRPYKPGKSMRRVLIHFWGKEGDDYVGRLLHLYCDPEVTFGKIKVGGVRIGGMSHIGDETEMALAVTKGAKKLFRVRRLANPETSNGNGNGGGGRVKLTSEQQVEAYIAALAGLPDLDALRDYQLDERRAKWREGLSDELAARVTEAQSARFRELSPPDDGEVDDDDDDTFPGGA